MIPALLLISVLSLSYWLNIAHMLASGWPWFSAIAFVLVRLKSGHSPLWWLDVALETLLDMTQDAVPTFMERLRERREEIGEEG